MNEDKVLERLDNLDRRVDRIEQYLPTMATRDELREAIAALATKAELSEAIAALATKAELSEAIAPLATKAELSEAIAPLATKAELRQEGERSRRYMLVLFEDMRSEVRLFMESHNLLERRVSTLEARARRRPH